MEPVTQNTNEDSETTISIDYDLFNESEPLEGETLELFTQNTNEYSETTISIDYDLFDESEILETLLENQTQKGIEKVSLFPLYHFLFL